MPAVASDRSDGVRARIRRFMEDLFLVDFAEVGEGSDLLQLGIMDSFGYVQLIAFLKDELMLPISDEEMLDNVLVSLDDVVAFVERKTV